MRLPGSGPEHPRDAQIGVPSPKDAPSESILTWIPGEEEMGCGSQETRIPNSSGGLAHGCPGARYPTSSQTALAAARPRAMAGSAARRYALQPIFTPPLPAAASAVTFEIEPIGVPLPPTPMPITAE